MCVFALRRGAPSKPRRFEYYTYYNIIIRIILEGAPSKPGRTREAEDLVAGEEGGEEARRDGARDARHHQLAEALPPPRLPRRRARRTGPRMSQGATRKSGRIRINLLAGDCRAAAAGGRQRGGGGELTIRATLGRGGGGGFG